MSRMKQLELTGGQQLALLAGRLHTRANMMDAFGPSEAANDIRLAAALIIEFQDKMDEAFALVADAIRMVSPRV